MSENVIHVRFIDAKTKAMFAQSHMPADRLPESFAPQTTLHIGDQDWEVLKADPELAAEFIASGTLTLTLSRVEMVSSKDILYSLSTISDELPGVTAAAVPSGVRPLLLHEDDWRQVEFVSQALDQAISFEFDGIRRVLTEAGVETGQFLAFKEVHVRSAIPSPITTDLLYRDLLARLQPKAIPYDGCAFSKAEGLITGGFAHQLPGVAIYGYHEAGRVKVLGLRLTGDADPASLEESAIVVRELMATGGLSLVDWCRCTYLEPDGQAVLSHLRSLSEAQKLG